MGEAIMRHHRNDRDIVVIEVEAGKRDHLVEKALRGEAGVGRFALGIALAIGHLGIVFRVGGPLLRMFREKEHICSVVDEHGSLAGIITLEDLLEELLGHEIVDEYDTVSDLRTLAKIMKAIQSRRKKVSEKVDSKHKSSS